MNVVLKQLAITGAAAFVTGFWVGVCAALVGLAILYVSR